LLESDFALNAIIGEGAPLLLSLFAKTKPAAVALPIEGEL